MSADLAFRAMGTAMRVVVEGAPGDAAARRTRAHPHGLHRAADDDAAAATRAFLDDLDARLSRFRPGSELCAMNADRRERVPASPLLRAAVGAGLWAAEATGGLVDPTLLPELEAAGYDASRDGTSRGPLRDALAAAPPRRPARPHPDARWRAVAVDERAGAVVRPPGVRIDTGGTGKGLAADAAAHRLRDCARVAVDCGGDIRVGGTRVAGEPFELEIAHPLTGEIAHRLLIAGGAIATSGLDRHVWRLPGGGHGHHLLDPSTGAPAWTGLVGATALAPTALEAETLAKAALLGGPDHARRVLAAHGGIAFHDDGRAEPLGLLAPTEALA